MSEKQPAGRYIQVVVNLPQLPDDRLYDYLAPADWKTVPLPGARVLVPFGGQKAEAVVWKTADRSNRGKIREIIAVLDTEPLLSGFQLSLIDWMAEHFFCRRSDLLRLFFPPGLRVATEKCWRSLASPDEICEYLNNLPVLEDLRCRFQEKLRSISPTLTPLPAFAPEEERLLAELIAAGLITTGWAPKKPAVKLKEVKAYRLPAGRTVPESISLTSKQSKVIEYMRGKKEAVPSATILEEVGVTSSVLEALCQKKLLEKCLLAVERNPFGDSKITKDPAPVLNMEQKEAFQQITSALEKEESRFFLLHGVTGSGKTEVYLRAIEETLKQGKEAIYLVPEISLTPQTVERVRSRFGEVMAMIHSGLAEGERFDQWWRIKRGEVKVAVGARSALYAPFSKIGLIIIDEEHEYTYKQEETPRYHVREVAKEICRRTGAVLILGSATPSLESYYAAEKGEYTKLKLTRRVLNRPLPEIRAVDLREEFKAKRFSIISPPLRVSIQECLARGEQVVLLLNRRGYATFVICRECGSALKCPSCDVTLTYHRKPNLLRCHYCDYKESPPDTCPYCRSHYIRYFGRGTQRLEEELIQTFPHARVARMDHDTTGRKGSHERIYRGMARGEVDILVGTQMVAKGLDLPRVTLVGIIAADTALNLPDFRAAERTYQMLTQAAGRAGRGEVPGTVLIQTFNPEHYSILSVLTNDEEGFYRRELAYREAGGYPPYTKLVRLLFSGLEKKAVLDAAQAVTAELKKRISPVKADNIQIIGPHPAAVERIQNRYRWQTLIKAGDLSAIYSLLPGVVGDYLRNGRKEVRIIIDGNPFSML